jgi:pimeloyl-ACP methyl ester carboxylesterase
MPVVSRREAAIYYETCGDGPPLVFAHGAGGNTLVWWQQVPHFASRYRVLTFDHRGFGRSRCDAGAELARYFADDLAAVLDHAGIERAAIVCQSMGGWTGLQLALKRPERVAALVLSGTPAGILTPKVRRALAALAQAALQMNRTPGWNEPHPALAADIFTRDPARGFLYGQLAALNPSIDLARRGLQEVTVDPADLAAWTIPTLVVAGEHDRLFAPDVLREVAAVIPGAGFEMIPTVGHSPYFEAPEEFNRAVEEFLLGPRAARPLLGKSK